MPIKIVCDTNTIISGLVWRGNEFQLLNAVLKRKAILFTSPPLLNEFRRVVNYPRLAPFIRDPNNLFNKLMEMSIIVTPKEYVKIVKEDPTDDRVLECALACEADYIISGDKKHLLKLKEFHGIPLVTTRYMLDVLMKK